MPAPRAARVRLGPPGSAMTRRPGRVGLKSSTALKHPFTRGTTCFAVAEASPQVSSLQLEVCFEAPTQLVPPTVIQTTGRVIASASNIFYVLKLAFVFSVAICGPDWGRRHWLS